MHGKTILDLILKERGRKEQTVCEVMMKLTKDTADCVSRIALEVKERRDAYHELIQQASEGPQVTLPTILFLEEELRWQVLQGAKEGRCGDASALLLRGDARTRH